MTSSYVRVTGPADLVAAARELSVRTLIFDVEPLAAPWHSSQESLDQGIARILGDVRTVPSVRMVVFATNSARRPSAVPSGDGIEVRYLASAEKPLRIAPYRGLPRPGAVAGDQLPTDGVLAYRLRFTFLHYLPRPIMPSRSHLLASFAVLALAHQPLRRAGPDFVSSGTNMQDLRPVDG